MSLSPYTMFCISLLTYILIHTYKTDFYFLPVLVLLFIAVVNNESKYCDIRRQKHDNVHDGTALFIVLNQCQSTTQSGKFMSHIPLPLPKGRFPQAQISKWKINRIDWSSLYSKFYLKCTIFKFFDWTLTTVSSLSELDHFVVGSVFLELNFFLEKECQTYQNWENISHNEHKNAATQSRGKAQSL